MIGLYEAVGNSLARGPRAADEIVAECRRQGLACRAETVMLFLRLSHEIEEEKGQWTNKGRSKQQRILTALARAFEKGSAYVPVARLGGYLGSNEPLTLEEIAAVCEKSGDYRLQGKFILRT